MEKFKQIVYVYRDGEIITMTYGELVRDYADQTTSPIGVMPRIHKREHESGQYEVWTWGVLGQNPAKITTFDNEEEADLFIYNTYEADLLSDCDMPLFDFSKKELKRLIKEM